MKKYKKIILLGALILIVIPLLVTVFVSFDIFHYVDVENSWSGFWGSYLGGVIGGVVTLYAMNKTFANSNEALNKQLRAERENEEKKRIFDILYELAKKYNKLLTLINKDVLEKGEYYYDWYANGKGRNKIRTTFYEKDIKYLWEKVAIDSALTARIIEQSRKLVSSYVFTDKTKKTIDNYIQDYQIDSDSRRARFIVNYQQEPDVDKNIEWEAQNLKGALNEQLDNIISLMNK